MVKFGLQLQANLENVTNLRPDPNDYNWCLKMKCTSCGEVADKWQFFNDKEELELKNSRGTANFISKCKFCSRENNLNVVPKTLKSYNAEDNCKLKTIIEFECRGLEPVDFAPNQPWIVDSTDSNTIFKSINLEENEWVDYDEESSQSVGIYEVKGSFIKIK